MVQSFKYSFTVLKNTKGFLVSMVVMPVLMIILVSLTLAYNDVALIGYTGITKPNIANIRLQHVEDGEVDYFLGMMQSSLVVHCNEDGSIVSYTSSIENNPLIYYVEQNINKEGVNTNAPKIRYSIGILLFKFFTAGGLLATYIIKEKQNGILLRVKNSKTTLTKYLLGKCLSLFVVYEIANGIILAFFKLAGFDFEQASIMKVGGVFTITLILSLFIYVFIASMLKNEGYIWLVSTGIIFPLGFISGILFPVKYMAPWMQTLARISPLYYLQQSIINGSITTTPIIIIVTIALILGGIGIHRLKYTS